jgi:hypothetical protein
MSFFSLSIGIDDGAEWAQSRTQPERYQDAIARFGMIDPVSGKSMKYDGDKGDTIRLLDDDFAWQDDSGRVIFKNLAERLW